MPDRNRRHAAPARIRGRRRACELANRLGAALRSARLQAGLTQRVVADLAGVSQGWYSEAERGLGAKGSVETWASLAAALGRQLAAFIELAPGSTPPRDSEHLRRQQVVIEHAAGGAWIGRPEVAIRTADGVHRSIDVVLERVARREIAVVEIVDLLTDIGEAMRGLERKVEAVASASPGATVRGLLVVRATARNRALIAEFGPLLRARFPASGAAWLAALTDRARPMPSGDGLLWSAVRDGRLIESRLGRKSP